MLKDPMQIRNLSLANRLVMPPMATYKTTEKGRVNAELCDYYEARAKGGKIGLIITEHTCIREDGLAGTNQMSMAEDSVIEPAKKLTEVIKKYGTKVVCQLNHAGSATNEQITGHPIVSASAVPCPGRKKELESAVLPKELTVEEIQQLEEAFARAALRAKQAGYDGVEIHSAHGYLLNQFYSPLTNKRHDAYGCDSMENRLRFALETVKKTRELCGEEYPIFLRLGGCDYMEGGSTIADAVEAAKLIEAAGVDCIDLSGGMCRFMIPDRKEAGYFSDMSKAVKEAVSIPVILTGGIKKAAEAEQLLQEGAADLIGVGRPLLADAEWAEKEMAEEMPEDFTHFNEQGRAKMVDVHEKSVTTRTAVAGGRVLVNQKTFDLIRSGGMKKGDVLTVAQIAGVMGAKRTPDLIPMCHPILIDGINLDLSLDEQRCSVEVKATVTCAGRTGVEMEALTAVSVACLTVYDMCKAVQKDMVITDIRLLEKTGGVHGDFRRVE